MEVHDTMWVDDEGRTYTWTNPRSCRKGYVGDGLNFAWRQAFYKGASSGPTHLGMGGTNLRTRIHFARIYGQSSVFGNLSLRDYVYLEHIKLAEDKHRFEMRVWKNIGGGGSKIVADGNKYNGGHGSPDTGGGSFVFWRVQEKKAYYGLAAWSCIYYADLDGNDHADEHYILESFNNKFVQDWLARYDEIMASGYDKYFKIYTDYLVSNSWDLTTDSAATQTPLSHVLRLFTTRNDENTIYWSLRSDKEGDFRNAPAADVGAPREKMNIAKLQSIGTLHSSCSRDVISMGGSTLTSAGLTSLGRAFVVIDEGAGIGLGIYDMVQTPSAIPLDLFGILFSVNGIRDVSNARKAALASFAMPHADIARISTKAAAELEQISQIDTMDHLRSAGRLYVEAGWKKSENERCKGGERARFIDP
ncbi:hypothetical protein K4K59_009683 [Colletotrichum sp. SAR11_240]|nr:hypothetical protein K4K59_009683 [Colletotrichum sp. SAR11_240]